MYIVDATGPSLRKNRRLKQSPPGRSPYVCWMLSVLLLGSIAPQCAAGDFNFITLDHPHATYTNAQGLSDNTIVGSYIGTNGVQHGYRYDGTTYMNVDPPAATSDIYACSIEGNTIVGYFSGSAGIRGFVYDGSNYTTLNYPGAVHTNAFGISGSLIVGHYRPDGSWIDKRGFILDGSTYTSHSHPLGAHGTQFTGVYGNTVVGIYEDANDIAHAFIYNGTSYTDVAHPLGVNGTELNGMWDNTVVGNYVDASGLRHGFFYDGSSFTTLDNPLGTQGTQPIGIYQNTVVGQYYDSSGTHGFVVMIPEPASVGLVLLSVAWLKRHRHARNPVSPPT